MGVDAVDTFDLGLRAVDALVHRQRIDGDEPRSRGTGQEFGGFELLRCLAPHYAECLRLEERRDVQIFADRARDRVLLIAPDQTWWPASDCEVDLRLALSAFPSAVCDSLSRLAQEDLVLGYLLQLVHAGDAAFLRPLIPSPFRGVSKGTRS